MVTVPKTKSDRQIYVFRLVAIFALGFGLSVILSWAAAIRSLHAGGFSAPLPHSEATYLWKEYAPQPWKNQSWSEIISDSPLDSTPRILSHSATRNIGVGIVARTVSITPDSRDPRSSGMGGFNVVWVSEVRTGFPLLSWKGAMAQSGFGTKIVTYSGIVLEDTDLTSLSSIDTALTYDRTLIPGRPDVVATIINSVFWGLILYFICLILGRTRRRIRYMLGKCPQCGYRLVQTNAKNTANSCPECGWRSRNVTIQT